MLNGLDLFSGYGGISRALSPWVRTVAYCENNFYRQLILLSEMERNRIDKGPIWDDVSTLQRSHFSMPIDIITGGWPCQGHSVAGARLGLEDERSGLAKELLRLIRDIRPVFCFLENVPGVFVSGFGRITAELSLDGYVGRYGVLSCRDVAENAWHERERVWIVLADANFVGHGQSSKYLQEPERFGAAIAPSNGQAWNASDTAGDGRKPRRGIRHTTERGENPHVDGDGEAGIAAHSHSQRLEGWIDAGDTWPSLPFITDSPSAAWPEGVPEPTLLGKVDGPAEWRNQIETLGGGVVPQVAREAFKRLIGIGG